MKSSKPPSFNCIFCPVNSEAVNAYTEHLRRHIGERPFTCTICKKDFSSKSDVNRHRYTHVKEKQFSCEICQQKFKTISTLRKHSLVIHTDPNTVRYFKCKFCDRKFNSVGNRNRHLKIHTTRVKHQCPICNKFLLEKVYLDDHLKTHKQQVKTFNCNICAEKLKRKSSLKKHMRIHSERRKLQCQICSRLYYDLKRHIINIHKEQTLIQCSVCPRKFPSLPRLNLHMRVHTGEKPYICEICGRPYSQKGLLTRHKESHLSLSESCFKCTTCGKVFRSRTRLKLHQVIHSKRNPCECAICGKSLISWASKLEHLKSHTGETKALRESSSAKMKLIRKNQVYKQYKCDECNKIYSAKTTLRIHIEITHNQVVKWFCVFCRETFKNIGNYRYHVNGHTNERPYICRVCGSEFKYGQTYRRLVKRCLNY